MGKNNDYQHLSFSAVQFFLTFRSNEIANSLVFMIIHFFAKLCDITPLKNCITQNTFSKKEKKPNHIELPPPTKTMLTLNKITNIHVVHVLH